MADNIRTDDSCDVCRSFLPRKQVLQNTDNRKAFRRQKAGADTYCGNSACSNRRRLLACVGHDECDSGQSPCLRSMADCRSDKFYCPQDTKKGRKLYREGSFSPCIFGSVSRSWLVPCASCLENAVQC